MAAVLGELARLEGADEQLRGLVEQALRDGVNDRAGELGELEGAEEELAAQRRNLLEAVARHGPLPMLGQRIEELESRGRELGRRRSELERARGGAPELPASSAEFRRLYEEKARGLAEGSPEFGDLLRLVVPEFRVHLVRLCDGGQPVPRARVRLDLSGLAPDAGQFPGVAAFLSRELEIDLFEPPQRERIRPEAVRMEAEGLEQREIARRLLEGRTQAAVFNALALDRRMRGLGLETPYQVVAAPPPDYTKLRHHLNPGYRFEPEQGYRPPVL